MQKLRVWWVPQVGSPGVLHIPVSSVEEAKKVLDILSAYDLFQLECHIKPDFCNMGGLEMWNESDQGWEDWYFENNEDYFDDVDEYCESKYCQSSEELSAFSTEVFSQLNTVL